MHTGLTALHRLSTRLASAAAALFLVAAGAAAEVTRIDVAQRAPIGTSGYEKVIGTVHFALDPQAPRNRVIVHLDKAPVNAAGRVEFSSDFYIVRPMDPARSNGVALVEVVNRGRKLMLRNFTGSAASAALNTEADLGDGFLTRQGYTLAWVGWQFDVASEGGLLAMRAPRAAQTSTLVRAEFTPNDRGPSMTLADLGGYPPSDPSGSDTRLTVRTYQFGEESDVDRAAFSVSGPTVTMKAGFEPGRIYTLVYRTANPAVAGLGLAAFRDFGAWLKHGGADSPRVRYAYAWGSSQSGRFLRTFLYYGFNGDEGGSTVFDGVTAHIAGAARLSINEAAATPNALSMFSATAFPYANQSTHDPVSGRAEGLLENERAQGHQPKVMLTNSAVEYWGGGRSAALVHVSPDGARDLTLRDNERVYFLTGTQHSPGRFPARVTQGQQPENPVEYNWTLRALLQAMDGWVRHGKTPPPSRYPKLSDGTLVPAARVAFPTIPGVASPKTVPAVRVGGKTVPFLVPQVDDDGNEAAGVRTPEITVPLATYTGWNFRSPGLGGSHLLVSLMGSAIPFAPAQAQRAAGDQRRSVAERYRDEATYLEKVRADADGLVTGGYLLREDVAAVVARAKAQWVQATGGR